MQPQMNKRPARRRKLWLILLIIAVALVWFAFGRRRVVISPARLRSVPAISQGDYTQTLAVFGGENKSVQTSGCGAVSMAMAIGYLKGAPVSPEKLFDWALDEGHYFGDGLGHEALTDMAEEYGIRSEWIKNDPAPVLKALEAGYPVIAHMGPGTFTLNGHYILLRGVDDDGLILVNDPGSRERTDTPYEMSLIVRELRRPNSFMILKPK